MSKIIPQHVMLAIFFFLLVFQVSQAKYLVGIDGLAPVLTFLVVATSLIYIFYFRITFNLLIFYIVPICLIILGGLLNYIKNTIQEGGHSSNIAVLFPYIYALGISYYIAQKDTRMNLVLNLYVNFITIFSGLALLDLILFFMGLNGLTPVETTGGEYFKGYFAFYHLLEDDVFYFRMYGVFAEPGTYAMYLIPALLHNWFLKRYIFFTVNILCLIGTFSLGGYFGLLCAAFLILLYSMAKTIRVYHVFAIVLIIVLILSSYDFLAAMFDGKGESRSLRMENVTSFFYFFSDMVRQYPLGYPFFVSVEQMQKESYFVSTNFTLFNIYMVGGLISLIGYVFIILLLLYYSVIYCRANDIGLKIFSISIPVFILFLVQRTTPFDTPYFAFLIAPYLIRFLSKNSYD